MRRILCFLLLGIWMALLAEAPAGAGSGADGFDPWTETARYAVMYRVVLPALERGREQLWIPLPGADPDQQVLSLEIASPVPAARTRDGLGNRMAHLARKGPAPPIQIEVRALVDRRPTDALPEAAVSGQPAFDPARFLRAQARIPLDGVIRRISDQVATGHDSDASGIRAIYDYVVAHMTYAKRGKGWGHGDAVWACTAGYGNCTDFHSLAIGLARSQGIPARFEIGFPLSAEATEGKVAGYHCWARAFDRDHGWIPFDASEARTTGRRDAYFGTLPADRVMLSVGRDLQLAPPQDGPRLNFFVYPYVEVDGAPTPTPAWTFVYRRITESALAQQ